MSASYNYFEILNIFANSAARLKPCKTSDVSSSINNYIFPHQFFNLEPGGKYRKIKKIEICF